MLKIGKELLVEFNYRGPGYCLDALGDMWFVNKYLFLDAVEKTNRRNKNGIRER